MASIVHRRCLCRQRVCRQRLCRQRVPQAYSYGSMRLTAGPSTPTPRKPQPLLGSPAAVHITAWHLIGIKHRIAVNPAQSSTVKGRRFVESRLPGPQKDNRSLTLLNPTSNAAGAPCPPAMSCVCQASISCQSYKRAFLPPSKTDVNCIRCERSLINNFRAFR